MYTGSLNTTQKKTTKQDSNVLLLKGEDTRLQRCHYRARLLVVTPYLPCALKTGRVASQDDDTMQLSHLLMECKG